MPITANSPAQARALRIACTISAAAGFETLEGVEAALAEQNCEAQSVLYDLRGLNRRAPVQAGAYRGPGTVEIVTPGEIGRKESRLPEHLAILANGGSGWFRSLVAFAEEKLRRQQTDVLVQASDRTYYEYAFLCAAYACGIPAVMVPPGPFTVLGAETQKGMAWKSYASAIGLLRFAGLLPRLPINGLGGYARIAAASDHYRRAWIELGVDPARVVTTGIVRYDKLTRLASTRSSDPRTGRFRILLLWQPFVEHGRLARSALVRALHLAQDAARAVGGDHELVIRCHPRSSEDDIRRITEPESIECVVTSSNRPIEDDVVEASVVLGFYSSAMLETALLGAQTLGLALMPEDFNETAEFEKTEWMRAVGFPMVSEVADLAGRMRSVAQGRVSGMTWSEGLENELGPRDGHAADRVASLLLEVSRAAAGGT